MASRLRIAASLAAVFLVCVAFTGSKVAADETGKESEEKEGMKGFDFGKMFDGLKGALKLPDGDLSKFGDLFGDLTHFKDLFERDKEGKNALKDLDLTKLFDGIKDKKDKKKMPDMMGECDGPGATCRSNGVPVCQCAPESFCAANTPANALNNSDTCVLRPRQPCLNPPDAVLSCVVKGGTNPECSSGTCQKTVSKQGFGNGTQIVEKVKKCAPGLEGSPCTNNTDCDAFDGLACNTTVESQVCDVCGPAASCEDTGCCDGYRCKNFTFGDTGSSSSRGRRLNGGELVEKEVELLRTTSKCCADTGGAPCTGRDGSCCDKNDVCVRSSEKQLGVASIKTCCRSFGAPCESASECCPTSEKGGQFGKTKNPEGSDCRGSPGAKRCCIAEGASCSKSKAGKGILDCCGNDLPANSQINCIGGGPDTAPRCGACITDGNTCTRNTECCSFLRAGDEGGQACQNVTEVKGGEKFEIIPGTCEQCSGLNETCTKSPNRRLRGSEYDFEGNDCWNNPEDLFKRMDCGRTKDENNELTEGARCCVQKKGKCQEDTDCCQKVKGGEIKVEKMRECDAGHCRTRRIGMDRRRMSGGVVGVDAARSTSTSLLDEVPLNALNRTNPHASEAKRDAMRQSKEKMERKKKRSNKKRNPTKAPWLDHLFGFSLAFSHDCSLLAVGEPGTDEQQGAVSVYRLRTETPDSSNQPAAVREGKENESASPPPLPFTFATRPSRRLVTRRDPPLAGCRLSWAADPTRDRVSLQTRRLTLRLSSETPPLSAKSSPTESSETALLAADSASADAEADEDDRDPLNSPSPSPHQTTNRQVQFETVNVDLAPPRRRFSPRSRDRGGKALFGTAVAQCSVPLKGSGGDEEEDAYVHFLAVSAPGSWHGNVYVYVLTEGEGESGLGGSVTGSVGDDLSSGFGYEMVQELVSQGGRGPFDFLQRLSLRDAGGFGEARMGQTVRFERRQTQTQREMSDEAKAGDDSEEWKDEEIILLTTEQREGAQAYGFRMFTRGGKGEEESLPVWPPFSRLQGTEMESFSTAFETALE
uniref:Disintegrin domain-containing protein n=1 Tax=Chromera velia CCMP2878 TaxID=1169474 RepID=A0A0G4I012_9ALVE|eukprot:Cvel_9836.t1-p1 / transcript=Cvel_9836.t1 / gene=Cvel_9836 / organism=Chromera_velia_CCMP2878 / gene_product=hypothetical protein / transcript_product=hypothetical protein / location=Cvel_scaffold579:26075-32513(-) / protein_length=1043 / sequence_SO=supercontig / SO=protein_coding / is_pseudo=false